MKSKKSKGSRTRKSTRRRNFRRKSQSKRLGRGGNPTKTKHVAFKEPEIIEFETRSEESAGTEQPVKCPSIKYIRRHHFPCKYKGTVFDDMTEFSEWYIDELRKRIPKKAEKRQHLEKIRTEQLSESGNWNRYIPQQFRAYTDEGVVEDALPFSESLDPAESVRLLRDARNERALAQQQWSDDVKTFRFSTDV